MFSIIYLFISLLSRWLKKFWFFVFNFSVHTMMFGSKVQQISACHAKDKRKDNGTVTLMG